MGSNIEIDERVQEAVRLYGADAVKFATTKIRIVVSAYDAAKKRRAFPSGTGLAEALRYQSWSVPDVFTEEQFTQFRVHAKAWSVEEGLRALWVVMENACGLTRVRPAYTPSDDTHEMVVRLI